MILFRAHNLVQTRTERFQVKGFTVRNVQSVTLEKLSLNIEVDLVQQPTTLLVVCVKPQYNRGTLALEFNDFDTSHMLSEGQKQLFTSNLFLKEATWVHL